ncbi:MAG: PilZ domain-containing protein [Deltaproteobacteria bacterium]|nr:PilZ domain-containing protein [Deltaproteobacteria bacterium]
MAERRTYPRYSVRFPVHLDGGQLGTAVGVSKDASADGIRLQANADLRLGAPVRLRFRVAPHEAMQDVDGTVVRVEPSRERRGEWPYQLAVQFDDLEKNLEQRLQIELAQRRPTARA